MFSYFLIFLFFCFFIYLAWRNLVWAAGFIVAFLPAYLIRFSLGPIPMTLLEGMILILFVVWLLKSLRGANAASEATISSTLKAPGLLRFLRSLAMTRWLWLITVWLIIATLAMFVSPDLRAAAGIWKAYFVEPILFLIIFLSIVREKKELKLIFYALGFSALYISAFAIYQKFTGIAIPNPIWQAAETRRVTSFYGYPNAIGLFLAPIVTLYFGWLISNFQFLISKQISNFKFQISNFCWPTIFQILVIILSTTAIIFARTEGAYFGIFAGLLFLGLMIKKLRWPTLVITAILALTVLFIPSAKNYVWQQISFQDASGKVRLIQWQETWEMLKDRPLLGAGLAGYQETFAPYHKAKHIEIYLYPHNLFLNFWSELGILGLIVFLLLVFNFFKLGFKKWFKNWKLEIGNWKEIETNKILLITFMASMITVLVHGLVDVPYFKNDLSILFWIIIGFSIIRRRSGSERDEFKP